jgi:aminopeptidase
VTDRLRRYAELAVRVGANVEPGQIVEVTAFLDHAPLVREVARCAYREGAAYVDVLWIDQHVRKAMIELAPDERLSWTPPWLLHRLEEHVARRAAHIAITGEAEPGLLADLDQARVGRARTRELNAANLRRVTGLAVNWTLVAYPTAGWAQTVLGEPDVERLWAAVADAVRLDEPDPPQAWDEHLATLDRRAGSLNERRFDAIHFRGPGTDLTVGLLPGSHWRCARAETTWGRRYVPNLPTEEVYTTPDPTRAEGVVRTTRPLPLGGTVVRDLELRFAAGRAVEVNASSGAAAVRAHMATDDGGASLGEVALVDGASRVGRTGLTFYEPLLDENATCHLAYGAGIPACVEGDTGAVNRSAVHVDFMVGGRDVEVDGVLPGGSRVPLLREDTWQLD